MRPRSRGTEAKLMNEGRRKALDGTILQIERQFGKGAIMRLGDEGVDLGSGVISTGSLGVDLALGVGGVPRGRVVEIYGPESGGKTTLALHVAAEAQAAGGVAAFVDRKSTRLKCSHVASSYVVIC